MKKILILIGAILLTGCQTITYKDPKGVEVKHSKKFMMTNIGKLSLVVSTNGIKSIELEGYISGVDAQTAVIVDAVIGAAVEAAVKGAIPGPQ